MTSSRDPRFVALHRGGSLTPTDHRLLAGWAAACAARVLPLFEAACPGDTRPAGAIAAARAWASGDIRTGQAQRAAVGAHAAARETQGAAQLAARACGHAAATAHMADHELGAAYYGLLALEASGASPDDLRAERTWQVQALAEPISALVRSDMEQRAAKFRHVFDEPA